MAGGAPGPGDGRGRQRAAGGVLIDRHGKLTEQEDALARSRAELDAGLRCGGCGERVSSGFEFVLIDTGKMNGKVWANYRNVVACTGIGGCGFAAEAIDHAVAMRTIRQRFVDGPEMRERIEMILKRAKEGEDGDGGGGDGGGSVGEGPDRDGAVKGGR